MALNKLKKPRFHRTIHREKSKVIGKRSPRYYHRGRRDLGIYRFYKAPMEEEALKQMLLPRIFLKKTLSTWLLTAMGTPPVSWKSLTNTVLLLAEIWLIIMQELLFALG